MTIFEIDNSESQSFSAQSAQSFDGAAEESMNLSSGGCDCPDMGFFRVFHIPDFPPTITNFIFDGPIFVPIDAADYADRLDDVKVLIDGQESPFADFTSRTYNGQLYDGIDFYCDRVPNGTHQIQLQAYLRLDDTINEETPYVILSNNPVSIHVTNLVSFVDWDDLIVGTNFTFTAKSLVQDTDWTIEIYDVVGDFVISQTGHTTNGVISWTWDLYDWMGNLRTDLDYDPFFDPRITVDDGNAPQVLASPQQRNAPVATLDYPAQGYWLVAYQDRVKNLNIKPDYVEAMQAIQGGPASEGIPNQGIELKYGKDVDPDPSAAQTIRNNSWLSLRGYLFSGARTRNFYYQGHGGPDIIGGDYDKLDKDGKVLGSELSGKTSKAYLESKWVKENITFNKYGGARPFRFVWLDGCQTARGKWAEAFGMGNQTNDLPYYQNPNRKPHARPSAFVGWNEDIGGGPKWGFTSGYRLFRTEWMNQWKLGDELKTAFTDANNASSWVTPGVLDGALRVFGYQKLKFNEYNRRENWPGP